MLIALPDIFKGIAINPLDPVVLCLLAAVASLLCGKPVDKRGRIPLWKRNA